MPLPVVVGALTADYNSERCGFHGLHRVMNVTRSEGRTVGRMTDRFHSSLGYMVSQLYQAADSEPARERVVTALAALPEIRKLLSGFRREAEERGFFDELKDWPYIEHAMGALEEYCASLHRGAAPPIHQKTARIFVSYVDEALKDLKKTAEEVDAKEAR